MVAKPVTATTEALAIAVAHGLHANGHETSETIRVVSRMAGEPAVEVFPGWDRIVLRRRDRAGAGGALVLACTPSGVAMNRVASFLRIAEAMPADDAAAARAVADAESLPLSPLPLFALACAAGAVALSVIFGSQDPVAVALIAAGAACGGVLRRLLGQLGAGPVSQPFAAALLAGIIGALAVRWQVSSDLRLVAVCQAMILVPGPHLLNGALDIAALRIPLGACRLAFASLILGAISFGLLLGLSLLGVSLPPAAPGRAVMLWLDVPAAGVAVAAYGVFFSMPLRMLVWPVLVGMLAHAARWWALTAFGVSAAMAAGIACLIVGIILVPVARRLRLPFSAVGFASVVSLMPGVYVFRMSSGLVQLQSSADAGAALLSETLRDGMTAALIVLAMTVGLVVPRRIYEVIARK